MKKRDILGIIAPSIIISVSWFFTLLWPDWWGNEVLSWIGIAGLVLWGILTLRDPDRIQFETILAWFTIPSVILSTVIVYILVVNESGFWFWMALIGFMVPINCIGIWSCTRWMKWMDKRYGIEQ